MLRRLILPGGSCQGYLWQGPDWANPGLWRVALMNCGRCVGLYEDEACLRNVWMKKRYACGMPGWEETCLRNAWMDEEA